MIKQRICTILILLLMGFGAIAQEKSCKEKWTDFSELATKNNFDSSTYQPWLAIKNCSENNEDYFLSGIKILSKMVEAANASAEKDKMIADLTTLFDEHDKKFPNNQNGNKIAKSVILFENNAASENDIFKFLDQAFASQPSQFKQPFVIDLYSKVLVNQFHANAENLDLNKVLQKLDAISIQIKTEKQKYWPTVETLENKKQTIKLTPEEIQQLNSAKSSFDNLILVEENVNARFLKLATCEQLESFYAEKIKGADAILTMQNSFEVLSQKKCTSAFYFDLTKKLHAEKPSAATANVLAFEARKNREQELAMKYFQEAAELETNLSKKAESYYMLATVQQIKHKEQARISALKALEIKPDFGKSYILISQLYANSGKMCGNSTFDQQAIYWLAAETAKKAGQVQPSFEKTANDLAEDYLRKAPSKEDLKKSGKKAGEVVTFSCWINQAVTIPK
ncbi:hypothetical protein GV828_05185 [Flavobacterium sp. NST-5]|uniref:Tetratricopeptide repeat protein n=1 Tax=Flavobacterium ichthyis TaxID=2698827 RepID=A0ABW9Z6U8_9FLAO|nr:hypothetical protein [Flavobacterium ichthyis]NBL64593.1 hypothetical protein [Flavobacterium ichthyis]